MRNLWLSYIGCLLSHKNIKKKNRKKKIQKFCKFFLKLNWISFLNLTLKIILFQSIIWQRGSQNFRLRKRIRRADSGYSKATVHRVSYFLKYSKIDLFSTKFHKYSISWDSLSWKSASLQKKFISHLILSNVNRTRLRKRRPPQAIGIIFGEKYSISFSHHATSTLNHIIEYSITF